MPTGSHAHGWWRTPTRVRSSGHCLWLFFLKARFWQLAAACYSMLGNGLLPWCSTCSTRSQVWTWFFSYALVSTARSPWSHRVHSTTSCFSLSLENGENCGWGGQNMTKCLSACTVCVTVCLNPDRAVWISGKPIWSWFQPRMVGTNFSIPEMLKEPWTALTLNFIEQRLRLWKDNGRSLIRQAAYPCSLPSGAEKSASLITCVELEAGWTWTSQT